MDLRLTDPNPRIHPTAELKGCTIGAYAAVAERVILREVKLGDPVRVNVQIIAADDKRIHYFEELRHAEEGWVSATSENMTLHIDMNLRKVAPFPKDIYERVQAVAAAHAKAPQPDGIGRRIEIPKKR